MKQIIETEFQVYSTNNMCYVKYCYFLIYVLNIAEQYYVSKSDKDFYWRNTSIMLNTVGVFSNFCKKNKCFPYRISLDIFFFTIFSLQAQQKAVWLNRIYHKVSLWSLDFQFPYWLILYLSAVEYYCAGIF